MKHLLIILLIILSDSSSIFAVEDIVNHYLLKSGRNYSNLTENVRKNLLLNAKIVRDFKNSSVNFKLDLNSFSDLNPKEFVENYCGTSFPPSFKPLKPSLKGSVKPKLNNYILETLPENLDWRPYVSSVLNQKKCGNCWAHATMAMLGKNLHYPVSPSPFKIFHFLT